MKQLLTLVVLLVPLTAAADAPTPAARAKASIEAQLVTFQRGLAGEPAFLALFEPDGVIVADRAVMTAATIAAGMAQPYRAADHDSFEVHSLLARLFGASGDGKTDRTIKKLKLGKVIAGGYLVMFDLRREPTWQDKLTVRDVSHAGKRVRIIGC